MELRTLLADDNAVSPVIGVILMVAITVILAAVIGTFVLGLGDQVSNTSPQASFTFDYDSGAGELTVTHDGGDSIQNSAVSASVSGTEEPLDFSVSDVSAGDSATVAATSSDTVRVVWQSPNGGDTSTLGKWTGPDA